jgi:hypothetical protein
MSYLPDNVQQTLRQMNKISDTEVVEKEGDVYVAVDVVSRHRRILTVEASSLVESLLGENPASVAKNKKLLKG